MKKIITFLLFAALALNLFAQYANEQANLEKYWYYRKRLQDNFLYLNPYQPPGSNIPVDRLVPNTKMVNGKVVAEEITQVEWDDCNGALPYYLMLLATEYKLLKKYNQNTDASATLQELSRAVQAVRRLDTYADGIENGVFRRTDILFLERSTSRHIDILGAHQPLVNHFDNKSGDNIPLRFNFAERFQERHLDEYPSTPSGIRNKKSDENLNKDKYNSVDNVIKFIEAEAMVRKLLADEGSTAVSISNTLKNSVKLMIENMYHFWSPRSMISRDIPSLPLRYMNRIWYLKDPDISSYYPKNLIPTAFGGAGDAYTWVTGYGLSKAADKYNMNTYSSPISYFLFKTAMNIDFTYGKVRVYANTYYFCDPDTTTVFVTSTGSEIKLPIPNLCIVKSRAIIHEEYLSLIDNSLWMIRSLAATNDISPNYIELFSKKNSTYNFLKESADLYPKVLEQYPLIWSVLNTKEFISNADRSFIGSLLNSAPACGPYNIEHYIGPGEWRYYDFEVFDWSCPNRFVWSNLNGGGYTSEWKRSGYFNGIDYMVLHNLYWLTRVDQAEYSTTYVDNLIRNQPIIVSSKSEYDYARNTVKFVPGFKVTVSGDYKYVVGTNPNMRTGYDPISNYYKVNVSNYASQCNCEPIFKDSVYLQKSAFITDLEGMDVLEDVTINVFPNPSNESISVTCKEPIQRITLLNSTGKILFDYSGLSTESYTFTITDFPNGIYFVKTTTNSGHDELKKIIKKE